MACRVTLKTARLALLGEVTVAESYVSRNKQLIHLSLLFCTTLNKNAKSIMEKTTDTDSRSRDGKYVKKLDVNNY